MNTLAPGRRRRRAAPRFRTGWVTLPALVVCLCGVVSVSPGGGTRDINDGWLIATGELVARLWTDEHSDQPPGSGAAHGSRSAGRWAWCGRSRLFGIPELPLLAVGGGWSLGPLQGSVVWQRIGSTLVHEDCARIAVTRCFGWQPTLRIGWDRLTFGDGERYGQPYLGIGVTIPGPAGVRLRLEPHLTAPPPWYSRSGGRRWLLLTGGRPHLVWAAAIDLTPAAGPVVQLDLTGRVTARLAFGLRAEPATGVAGATIAWYRGTWILRTSHLMHPELGLTHRWYLAVGNLGAIR